MKASPVGTIFYGPEEVAEILGVSRDAVMRLIRSRELAAVRFSSRIYRVMDFQLAAFHAQRNPK